MLCPCSALCVSRCPRFPDEIPRFRQNCKTEWETRSLERPHEFLVICLACALMSILCDSIKISCLEREMLLSLSVWWCRRWNEDETKMFPLHVLTISCVSYLALFSVIIDWTDDWTLDRKKNRIRMPSESRVSPWSSQIFLWWWCLSLWKRTHLWEKLLSSQW